MADEKFDVIIVGAGPSGVSAAITLARAGLHVVVLERGQYPGAKNVQGAILYTKMLADIIPEFWKDPEVKLERYITQQNVIVTGSESAMRMGYNNDHWKTEPHNCYSIIRAEFDQWYAKQAEKAGAEIYTGVTVSKLLQKNGQVVGIQTSDGDQLEADVVIACDGVNSMLAQSIGLIDEWKSSEVALGVKEVMSLSKEKIEDRFNLEDNEGATYEIFGKITKGMLGYCFLYTNKESLSFGIGCKLSHFQKQKISPYELLEEAKKHTAVRRFLRDAKTIEYSAHLIPEGGYHSMPPLYTDGLLIAGDAAQMVNASHREGSNLAMQAGRLAAETCIEAKKKGDFSKSFLSLYQKKLQKSFVLPDLEEHKDLENKVEENMDFLTVYPQMASRALYEYFTVDGRTKKAIQASIFKRVRRTRSIFSIMKDFWKMR